MMAVNNKIYKISSYTSAQLKIRAGEWDTQTTKERLPYQERGVQEMYTHEDFHTKNLFNDIALLKLDVPVNVTDHVNVICLPEQDAVFEDNRNCIANGWGKDVFGRGAVYSSPTRRSPGPVGEVLHCHRTRAWSSSFRCSVSSENLAKKKFSGQAGRYAVILKKIEVDMMTHSTCLNRMRSTRLGPKFQLHPSFVCAGGEEGKDTCQGDGGAPLACPVGDDRYTLTGLVSWGIGCGGKGVPGVYTKTSMFRNWIDQKMDEWQYIII
ncbi:Phenoloxidase-activating factor 2 [Eumeta japonica]|uniref:Phenoloxidase-activating factor 2 n=1 Tax=Eumeta variegata TaxID=151549 RepID=A0A4C1Y0A7_EUMVA|nr:Phenoloxidase-activating factor 2 [Eumeta japonica]